MPKITKLKKMDKRIKAARDALAKYKKQGETADMSLDELRAAVLKLMDAVYKRRVVK